MGSNMLSNLTITADYLGMGLSLWLAFYLLPRGRSNALAYRLFIVLIALWLNYFIRLIDADHPIPTGGSLIAFAISAALIAAHNLTHYLLPKQLQSKYTWVERGIILLGLVIGVVIIVSKPSGITSDEIYLVLSQGE
ncbi:MAG: hypothetical protein FVQ83_10735 [Chloroflexi bacterium]|nr:hypothetical protein [Chloroflexota bacterium]